MKVVINKRFGGFSLSRDAFLRLRAMGHPDALKEPDYGEMWDDGSGPRVDYFRRGGSFCRDIPRHDPQLVQVVQELGQDADGECAELAIVEIPDGVDYTIEEYDGTEWIAECHRTWHA